MMRNNHLRIYLLFFLSGLFISACSQLGLQSKKETSEPASIPDCKKNYTKEGNFISGRVYKTWVKYDNLDYKKGFDAAVTAIKARGNRVIFADRDSGTIAAAMAFETQEQTFHSVDINLVKENKSLTIYISSKAAGGSSGPAKLCSFYDDFEKLIKRGPPASQLKQPPPPPPQKPPEQDKGSPSPPPVAPPKPSSAVSPSPPPKTPLPHAEVIWATVNLREGPGTNYKVVRTVKKGTSLAILEEKKEWLRVRLEDGKEAWVNKAATSRAAKTPPSTTSPPASTPSATPDAPKPKSPM
jgi:hypothetical protein